MQQSQKGISVFLSSLYAVGVSCFIFNTLSHIVPLSCYPMNMNFIFSCLACLQAWWYSVFFKLIAERLHNRWLHTEIHMKSLHSVQPLVNLRNSSTNNDEDDAGQRFNSRTTYSVFTLLLRRNIIWIQPIANLLSRVPYFREGHCRWVAFIGADTLSHLWVCVSSNESNIFFISWNIALSSAAHLF